MTSEGINLPLFVQQLNKIIDELGNMGISDVIRTTSNQGTMLLPESPDNFYH